MVVDSSAVLAILFNEPERDMFSDALADAGVRLMSSVNGLETAVVVSSRNGLYGAQGFDLLLHRAEFEVVPFTADHLRLARDAYERYGKGRHPAGLNLGDCCAYALARPHRGILAVQGRRFLAHRHRSRSLNADSRCRHRGNVTIRVCFIERGAALRRRWEHSSAAESSACAS